MLYQVGSKGCGIGKSDVIGVGVVRNSGVEPVGLHKHAESSGLRLLAAQFFGGSCGIGGDGLLQFLKTADFATERFGTHDAFFVFRFALDGQASGTTQFKDDAFANDGQVSSHPFRIGIFQVSGGSDAIIGEEQGILATNTPYIFYRDSRKVSINVLLGETTQVDYSFIAACFLAVSVAILVNDLVGAIPTETGMPVVAKLWRVSHVPVLSGSHRTICQV